LRQDLIDNTESWENQNLNDFFQAIDSYAEDIQGYYDNNSIDTNADKTNWHRFADILKGATIYE
jgi:glycine cleavage system protein P-like pyridoxal-binding family